MTHLRWTDESRQICPSCGGLTEEARVEGGKHVYIAAERCPRCRWQMNLIEKPRLVLYGADVSVQQEASQ